MPNTSSAKKYEKVNEKNRLRNRAIVSPIRKLRSKLIEKIEKSQDKDEVQSLLLSYEKKVNSKKNKDILGKKKIQRQFSRVKLKFDKKFEPVKN